ncbi:hypothetical protein PtrSN002B_007611 [Pyrenophora tritici-repentis]|uniref:Uncharacterized protein n=2 Tax=Pyrenophora tritici-repentis TaxID=45151 RepID=A0A2W1DBN9_9PLEO|nr:uncharacterized protein PTRG_07167 [Pyrenophora tritici-repentis Pt-1C-BFP]KAA8614734.1 hypothetical protein PtrV1_11764 [Pyrenophora tritici-repentis]EDU50086.1 conserved hypothetical protein [Pyrenophora tritici-repentis Pt-1C-BFP]KAF7444561.1 hypothetical protein A1F99_111140 [Pyrenophora tritici-repentis]KAF7564780.1 hypothetical protein PtrM4_042140 [Pyrenophora tritici-repentis]KAG9378804.1 hypothetical protein A1F94_010573 [Pyrenophora tritici-repentis]
MTSTRKCNLDNNDRMASDNDSIKCKTCARVLATIAPTGLAATASPGTSEGCDTCQQFSTLYDAVQTADMDWTTYQNKRDSITKSFARENYKRAHMEFHNWLMTVEVPTVSKRRDHETYTDEDEVEQQDQGTKRRHSHSPTVQKFSDTIEMPDRLAQHHHNISLSLRPSPKRSRSMVSISGRKRLKFSETVEFPASYRSSEEYHRPSETYVRGRNAPPEGSEYMDTSGSGQTFLRFTQMKKVGAKWVELSEEELVKKKEGVKVAAEKTKAQETNGDMEGDLGRDQQTLANARTTRSARRAKETLGAGPAQINMTAITQVRSRKPRKPNETLLDGTLDRAQDAPSDVATALPIPNTHFIARESPDAPEDIGAGVQRLERQTYNDSEKTTTETRHNGGASDADVQEHHKGTCNTSIVACQGDAIHHRTGNIVIESDMLRAGPMGNASSCTSWEDAYMAFATTSDRPAAAQMVDEQAASIVHDDTATMSNTADNQD